MQIKECTACKKTLPLEAFDKQKLGKLGRTSKCKECKKQPIYPKYFRGYWRYVLYSKG